MGPDRQVADDVPATKQRSGMGDDPVVIAVLSSILHRSRPWLTRFQRCPQIAKRLGRHVGMTHDVLRLAHELVMRKTAHLDKRVIAVSYSTFRIGRRNDRRTFWKWIFFLRNRKIYAHDSPHPIRPAPPS